MSFLDDLKKQAEAKQQQEQLDTQSRLRALTEKFLLTADRMTLINRYLIELVNQLNVVKPEVLHNVYVEAHGTLENMRQGDYKTGGKNITIDGRDYLKEIQLRFHMVTDEDMAIVREADAIQRYRDYLWRNSLKFDLKEERSDAGHVIRGTFVVARVFSGGFLFVADYDNARISLKSKNFGGLGVGEYVYDADEVSEALLDEFAKYLVKQPNSFRGQGRHQLARAQALQKSAVARTQTVYPGQPPAPPANDEEGKKGLLGKLKSILPGKPAKE